MSYCVSKHFFVVLLKTEVKRTENERNRFPNFRHFFNHTSFICPVPCFFTKCFTIFLKVNSSSGSLTSLNPESILAKLRVHQVVRVTVKDWWKVQVVGAFWNVVADPLLLFGTKLSDPPKWRLKIKRRTLYKSNFWLHNPTNHLK